MASIQLKLSECTPKFTVVKHDEYPERMQYLNATLMHPTLGELATARCLQISARLRFKNAGDFLEIMDEDSQELHEFSVGLFDKNSNIRPWLVDGGPKSGSGCWGTELSVGDMLYIEDFRVTEDFRRRGVGSWLLQEVLTSSHMGYRGHAYCWPTPLDSTKDKAEWMKEQAAITAFYRKVLIPILSLRSVPQLPTHLLSPQNGFRRVGLTPFLAYSPEPSHPSHSLPIESDPETPSIDFESTNLDAPDLTADEICTQYPLHAEIATNKSPSVGQAIRDAHQIDAGSVHTRDVNGLTPLHVAANTENVHALRVLLDFDMTEDLKHAKNKDGETPLEGLESSMRSTKEFMETLVGVWKGYSDEGLRCEFLLKRAMGLPMLADEEGEYMKKRKFGCTCGMCAGGWLSPRMRFQLLAQSELQADMLRQEESSFKPRQPLSASELFHSSLDYLPVPLQREIYKSFYVGFYTIFDGISRILRTPNAIPTPQAVRTAALDIDPRAVSFYLGKGGQVEYVLDATVDISKEQSSLGYGTFEETFDVDESEEGEEGLGYRKLVKCANDLEFGGVRLGVGLAAGVRWGPYYTDIEEEEGMEVDEYDDSDSD
ncbi:hypothetical protein M413DRAFT_439023, partial [Hebeloma cylindrosporum]